MLKIRKAQDRGHFSNDWLDAHFSFSFGGYRDPEYDGYSDLLVLNEDRVRAGRGFAPHSHVDIEALSYPLSGEIEHRDSVGNVARMRPGDVQRMSAGRGITHSEMNASSEQPEHHLQFWIAPSQPGADPGYEQRQFERSELEGRLRLIASPDGREGSLTVQQDARVYAALARDQVVDYFPPAGRRTYLHVARGNLSLNGEPLAAGDGAIAERLEHLRLHGRPEAEVLLFDLR